MSLPNKSDYPVLHTMSGNVIPFHSIIEINQDNLSEEYQNHSAWHATILFAHAFARSETENASRILKRMKAEKSFVYRSSLKKETGINPTVAAIEDAVILDEEVQKAEEILANLVYKENQLESAVKAFAARKDMLIQLGAHERQERRQ